MMRSRASTWVVTVSCGLILGAAALTDWISYRDYSTFIVPAIVRYLGAGAAGFAISRLAPEAHDYVPAIGILVASSMSVPIGAVLGTICLLNMGGVADVALYSAFRAAAVHANVLTVFAVIGLGLGVLWGGRAS